MRKRLLLGLLGVPTLALAQSLPAAHGYLGLGVSVYHESSFRSSIYDFTKPTGIGPALTVGYQLSPRLAVQLSPTVQWGSNTRVYGGYQVVSGQAGTTITSKFGRTRWLVPVQLRATLTRPAARLRLDALAGAAWLHDEVTSTRTETDNSTAAVISRQDYGGPDNVALLTLGPVVRYRQGAHLVLALALPLHYTLRDYQANGLSDYLAWQPQLSACYALGGR